MYYRSPLFDMTKIEKGERAKERVFSHYGGDLVFSLAYKGNPVVCAIHANIQDKRDLVEESLSQQL